MAITDHIHFSVKDGFWDFNSKLNIESDTSSEEKLKTLMSIENELSNHIKNYMEECGITCSVLDEKADELKEFVDKSIKEKIEEKSSSVSNDPNVQKVAKIYLLFKVLSLKKAPIYWDVKKVDKLMKK